MTLIKCPECGKEISDKAPACPNCGCPKTEFCDQTREFKFESKGTVRELPLEEQPELFECYKCGRKIPTDIALCPFCNYNYGTYREKKKETPQNTKITCPNCGRDNIHIDIVQVGETSSGKAEVRKKSIITRTGNKVGRGFMTAMTGGLWALTPKKSDYIARSSSNTSVENRKICVCQDCGNSWYI